MHLTPERWARLLSGASSAEEARALRAHLEAPCEVCEQVLEATGGDLLDAGLDGLGPIAAAPPARFEAMAATRDRRARAKWGRAAVGALALAAGVVVVLGRPAPEPESRVKGSNIELVTLSAMVASPSGGDAAALVPVELGREYRAGSEVFFTYELTTPAFVYVGRVAEGHDVDAFYPPEPVAVPEAAGSHALSVGGVVHAYALSGVGKQRFVLVASPRPLSPALVRTALLEGHSDGGAVASVWLKVAP